MYSQSILVSSVGSFFSYVNDARSHKPEVLRQSVIICAVGALLDNCGGLYYVLQ